MKVKKQRVDVLLVQRDLAPSRAKAQALLMSGVVFVQGQRVDKAGTLVRADASVEIRSTAPSYVSRGGQKMAGALKDFEPHGFTVRGKVAADFGASTGGFVDCLLQNGAVRVHAIDVGHGLLHEKLTNDTRVVVHDRTNARNLVSDDLGETVAIVVIDASFIGLEKLLGAAWNVLDPDGELVALIKPQFQAGKQDVRRGRGVIRDPAVRQRIVDTTLSTVAEAGFEVIADAPCVIAGPKGNVEHFVYARKVTTTGDVT